MSKSGLMLNLPPGYTVIRPLSEQIAVLLRQRQNENRQWLTELDHWMNKGALHVRRQFKDVPASNRWLDCLG